MQTKATGWLGIPYTITADNGTAAECGKKRSSIAVVYANRADRNNARRNLSRTLKKRERERERKKGKSVRNIEFRKSRKGRKSRGGATAPFSPSLLPAGNAGGTPGITPTTRGTRSVLPARRGRARIFRAARRASRRGATRRAFWRGSGA